MIFFRLSLALRILAKEITIDSPTFISGMVVLTFEIRRNRAAVHIMK